MNDLSSDKQTAFVKKEKRRTFLIKFVRIILFLLFILLWELSAKYNLIDSFFFSSPVLIINSIYDLLINHNLLMHIGITLYETIISFTLVFLISFAFASLLWYNNFLAEILDPFLVTLNSLPKSALAPLFIVWLGTGMKTIIVAGISVAVFGSIITLYTGFKQVSEDQIKLIYTLGGNKYQVYKYIVLPSSIPIILSNQKVNIGLSLVGVIIGEFLAAKKGLGYLIIYGSQVFKLNLVILSITILCIIALILNKIIDLLAKYLSTHYHQ